MDLPADSYPVPDDEPALRRGAMPVRPPDPGIGGRLAYWLFPIRRRTIFDNLRHVFGDSLSQPQRRRWAQAHYGHLWRCGYEAIGWWLAPRRFKYRVEVAEAAWEFDLRTGGRLVLVAHLGNFELVPLASLWENPAVRGRFHVIRRPLPFGWLDRLVHHAFARAGIGVIRDHGALPIVEQVLRRGECVAFMLDQHAGPRHGVIVDFFGQPASTFRSLAELSLRLGQPAVPYLTWREPDGTHVVRFDDPIFPAQHADFETAVRSTTQSYSDVLEHFISRYPEQWFWVHRRWKASMASHRRRAERNVDAPEIVRRVAPRPPVAVLPVDDGS
ncbi:MAG: lysophospholipid acyltransferase family protein [Deltaproteobacteria bacterium]|nr:lysophospholipid acyltransferase family protein [Deltaproteobacteria bacterium]